MVNGVGIWGAVLRGAGHGMRGAGHGMRGCEVQGTGYGVARCRVRGARCGNQLRIRSYELQGRRIN